MSPPLDERADKYYARPFGNLYDSHDEALDADADTIYQDYIAELERLKIASEQKETDSEAWETWDVGVRALYKTIFYDALRWNYKLIAGMELYFAGSNAKSQGTFYSDVDAFVVFREGTSDSEIDEAKKVFSKVNIVCHRIFIETSQLYPDPLGINPAQLCGTPESLLTLIKDEDRVVDQGPIVASVMSSKPILGDFIEGKELKALIFADEELRAFNNARTFYDKAINIYGKPKEGVETIHIKEHITRPIDFILMGLRTEFQLEEGEGQVLSAQSTLQVLRERKLIPDTKIELLDRSYKTAMAIRFQAHKEAGRESDNISIDFPGVKALLDDVQELREFFSDKLTELTDKTVTGHAENVFPEAAKVHSKKGLSTNKKWGLASGIMMGLGIAIGGALVATGVFSPFGVGVWGIVALAASGSGAGLLATLMAKGSSMLFKIRAKKTTMGADRKDSDSVARDSYETIFKAAPVGKKPVEKDMLQGHYSAVLKPDNPIEESEEEANPTDESFKTPR